MRTLPLFMMIALVLAACGASAGRPVDAEGSSVSPCDPKECGPRPEIAEDAGPRRKATLECIRRDGRCTWETGILYTPPGVIY